MSVHYPQRGIAVLETFSDDTHRAHIKQLVEGEVFFLHFAPDAVDVFWPPVNFGFHPFGLHFAAQVADKIVNVRFPVDTTFVQQFGNTFVLCRMQIAEAVILQLPFELADA